MNKKGKKLTSQTVNAGVLFIVILIVLFAIYAELVPEAQTAGDSLNDSSRCAAVGCFYNASQTCTNETNQSLAGLCTESLQSIPLGELYSGTGIIFIILMAMLLVIVVISAFKSLKKNK